MVQVCGAIHLRLYLVMKHGLILNTNNDLPLPRAPNLSKMDVTMYIIRQPNQLKCYSQASTQLYIAMSLAALAHREEEPTIKYRQYENGNSCGIAPGNAIRFADYFLHLRMLCILVVK